MRSHGLLQEGQGFPLGQGAPRWAVRVGSPPCGGAGGPGPGPGPEPEPEPEPSSPVFGYVGALRRLRSRERWCMDAVVNPPGPGAVYLPGRGREGQCCCWLLPRLASLALSGILWPGCGSSSVFGLTVGASPRLVPPPTPACHESVNGCRPRERNGDSSSPMCQLLPEEGRSRAAQLVWALGSIYQNHADTASYLGLSLGNALIV